MVCILLDSSLVLRLNDTIQEKYLLTVINYLIYCSIIISKLIKIIIDNKDRMKYINIYRNLNLL